MKKGNKLTAEQWAALRAKHERGEYGTVLAREYGVNRSTVNRRAKAEGWLKRGALHDLAMTEARLKVTESIAATYMQEAKAANDRHQRMYKALQVISARMLKALEANLDEPDPKKRQKLTSEIHGLCALSTAIRNGVDGERLVMQLAKVDLHSEKEPDSFGEFCEQLAELREERRRQREE